LLLFIPTHYKVQVLYPPQTNGVYRNHPVYPSVQMSNSLTDGTDTDETLHSCSIQSNDVLEGG